MSMGMLIHSINKNISNTEIIAIKSSSNAIIQALIPHLRPALCVKIVKTEVQRAGGVLSVLGKGDNTSTTSSSPSTSGLGKAVTNILYIVWVHDVRCNHHWYIKKAYQEFSDLRDVILLLRPALASIPFPPKRVFKMVERLVFAQRMQSLELFLCTLLHLCLSQNPRYLSSLKLRIILERFLEIPGKYEGLKDISQIHLGNVSHRLECIQGKFHLNTCMCQVLHVIKDVLQVYIHHVITKPDIYTIIRLFQQKYMVLDGQEGEELSVYQQLHLLKQIELWREFVDNIQYIVFSCVAQDCYDIITQYGAYHCPNDTCNSCYVSSSSSSCTSSGMLL